MNFCLLILFIHAATGGRSSSAGKHCLNTPKSGKAWKVVNNFPSNNPFFVMDITPAKLSARILVKVFLPFLYFCYVSMLRFHRVFHLQANVPIFKDNENKEHNVLLRHGTRGWPLKFKRYKNKGTGCLFAGWSHFLAECNLKAVQVCVWDHCQWPRNIGRSCLLNVIWS